MFDLEALAGHGEPLSLRRGDVLVRQGEPSDVLYVVVSGRFSVHVDGAVEPVAEIGPGQPIGEIGFFAGLPRTATVIARRDASVLAFTRAAFDRAGAALTGLRDAVIVALARRLSRHTRPEKPKPEVRTIAVLPAGGSAIPPAFLDRLRAIVGAASRTAFVGAREVRARFPGRAADDPAIADWLNALEHAFDLVCFVADDEPTEWTRKCVRQADALLLVAVASAPAALNASEAFAFSIHQPASRRLVLLHSRRAVAVSGTDAWLQSRDVLMHHHVSLQDDADLRRLLAFLSGRAVGFVAGGGGALGSAHLGVFKAFSEAGAEFDILGGTSVGAAMTAAIACGMGPDLADRATDNIFVRHRAFRRYTVPRYGLIDHKVFDRALQAEYGDVAIEDLWRPFVAVSTNLTDQRLHVHRRGPVWQAVRASGSVPGVLPPFFTSAGEMLVDGGLMDNVPLLPIKAIKAGPNVAVVLSVRERTTYDVDYAQIPGTRQLLGAMINPFARRRWPRAPGIVQVIGLSMLASRAELQADDSDVVIRPDVPKGVRFMSWERHTEVSRLAYRDAAAWIRARRDAGDPGVEAVLRAAPPAAGVTGAA
jgi:NTE family protein